MKNGFNANRRSRSNRAARWKGWGSYEGELSTSATTALLILGANENWSPESYMRASEALRNVEPLGSLVMREVAERRARLL
jgi:hypothetical protein